MCFAFGFFQHLSLIIIAANAERLLQATHLFVLFIHVLLHCIPPPGCISMKTSALKSD